jgi:alpha-tubulin suppressor-like RCC1 family protein
MKRAPFALAGVLASLVLVAGCGGGDAGGGGTADGAGGSGATTTTTGSGGGTTSTSTTSAGGAGGSGPACDAPKHVCGGQCVDDAPAACGASCTACAAPDHATATCSGGQCGFACDADHEACGQACCPKRLDGITAIAAGARHTCALTRDGVVKCWGWGSSGQLGDGNAAAQAPVPVDVKGLWAFAIATGGRHSCALSYGGTVKCWGLGTDGQLGSGLAGSPSPVDVPGVKHAVALAAGEGYTCALLRTGGVTCWGANESGELGDGTTDAAPTPRPTASGFASLAGRYQHTCGVAGDGTLSCWGSNLFSELGLGNEAPTYAPSPVAGGVAAVAPGQNHTCAALVTGQVACWGANISGQNGTGAMSSSNVPAPIASGSSFTSLLASGDSHSCAVNAAGGVECWGSNIAGQLGLGVAGDKHDTPASAVGVGSSPSGIAAGEAHTCVVVDGGRVQCWGSNLFSELGSGASQPSEVPSPTPVVHGGVALEPPCPNAGERRCGGKDCKLEDATQCGVSCEACEAPKGGTVACQAGACVAHCDVPGAHVCGDACGLTTRPRAATRAPCAPPL